MAKSDLSYNGSLSRADALDHLNNLINNLKAGRVRLCAGQDSVDLDFGAAAQVSFSLEAKAKDDKNQISLKLSWRLPAPIAGETGGLTMEPVPETEQEQEPKDATEPPAETKPQADATGRKKAKAAPAKGKKAK